LFGNSIGGELWQIFGWAGGMKDGMVGQSKYGNANTWFNFDIWKLSTSY